MTALFLGLMSGTSMDGVDAAVCEFDDQRFLRVRAGATEPYPDALRRELLHLQRAKPALTLDELARLDHDVAAAFARAATRALAQARVIAADVRAVGSHGQTVFHDPTGARSSLQLGNPALIAAQLGITTVADFRRADIAHGGQGAPLVPAFHHAVFASTTESRAVVNIGGIANVTLLPDGHAAHVRGFDTGPGNSLLDEWISAQRGEPMDRDGAWGATGRLHEPLLEALLAEPYFRQPPPKSTGRDRFNLEWVRRRFPDLQRVAAADLQRTLCELTAATVANAIRDSGTGTRALYLCGGGSRNALLVERLRQLLPEQRILDTGALGLDPGAVEPAAFAWLAMRTLSGLPGNLPAVTGAARPAILGAIYQA